MQIGHSRCTYRHLPNEARPILCQRDPSLAMKPHGRTVALAVNPATVISPPRPPRSKPTLVRPEVARAIMEASRGTNLEVPVLLGFGVGLRRSEIYCLRWQDVDLDAGTISVVQVLQVGGVFTEPKAEKSRRVVSIPAFVAEGLRSHRVEQARRRLVAGEAWHNNGLLCERGDGRPVAWKASHDFKLLVRRLGFPELHLHDTRHGFGYGPEAFVCPFLLAVRRMCDSGGIAGGYPRGRFPRFRR